MRLTVQLASPTMNRLEAEHAAALKVCLAAKTIQWFGFECITLRIGNDCRYTPDFMVIEADGQVEMHEVKGFMRDDALVKLKSAAAQFPMFRFRLWQKKRGTWEEKEIG